MYAINSVGKHYANGSDGCRGETAWRWMLGVSNVFLGSTVMSTVKCQTVNSFLCQMLLVPTVLGSLIYKFDKVKHEIA